MRRIALIVACIPLVACGSAGTPRPVDRSRLAPGQTAAIVEGQPAIVDRDGVVLRTIGLACRGFVMQRRRHACTDPTVESVAVSPDRTLLAYTRVLDGLEGLEPWREIGVIGVDGFHQRDVIEAQPSADGGVSNVSWDEDGRHLLFVYEQERLESVRIDGRARRVLGHTSAPPGPPAAAGLAEP